MAENRRSKENETLSYKNLIIGSVTGSVMFFVLIALFSLVFLKTDLLSASFYMPCGLISGAVSGFVSGFVSVIPVKKNGVLTGALSGLFQALICSAAVFFINNNNSGTGIFILMALITVSGMAGGVAAVNIKMKKRYR